MSDLIDTTEMYLRTVYELLEEGVVPMRARIAERLGHSGPTVSQTIARMERDGLIRVTPDRHLELTADGRALAMRVMRKHRLAERLLTDIIKLDWPLVHDEACRWEHVMSERVEVKLWQLLGEPEHSPYGNPIPGVAELGAAQSTEEFLAGVISLGDAVGDTASEFEVARLGEPLQTDIALLASFEAVGLVPGSRIHAVRSDAVVTIGAIASPTTLDLAEDAARHIFVRSGSGDA